MTARGAALPLLLLLALYWPGLTCWFYQDDFGWLRLRQRVHTVSDLPAALFAPEAHGNTAHERTQRALRGSHSRG